MSTDKDEKDQKDEQELDGDLAVDDETAEQVTGGVARHGDHQRPGPEHVRP